jgi:tetratricopeptide (TPR) repeat protein
MPPLGAEHANKPECPAAAPSVEAGESSVAIDFDLPEDFDRLARSDRIAADADLEAGRTGASASQPSTTGKPDASRAWQFSRPDEHATGGMPRPEGPGPVDSEPGRCEPESEHWPSIRSIWRPAIGTTAERGDSRSRREAFVPSATAIRGPELWRPPVWIAVPALLAAALVVGGGAIGLSWSWADDARVAGPVANYWTSGDVTGAIARFAQPPNLAWWATTADALVLHAASVAATAQDALDREDQRTMLDLAAAASPTHPGVRFARQASGGKRPQGAPTSVASQDVASLGLAAVRGLAAGQRSAAIDRLRDALALSARLEPEIAEYPALDREANGLRLELPQEDVVNRLLRAVGSQITRGKLDWEEVMPDHAGPWLALYRWSRSHARSEARSILERIASLPAYPDSGDLAWHRAARAEALAAAGKWSDAASAYRESLELKPGPLLASVVWFNLGDILARLGEADAARQARRTSRQLAAALPDRPREQARQLHETLEGDGPIRISSSR